MSKIKAIILIIGVFLIGGIIWWFFSSSSKIELVRSEVLPNKCYTQYQTCEFAEKIGEEWEASCDPVFKKIKVLNVGNLKVLAQDESKNELIYPKDFFIVSKPAKSKEAVKHSIYWYESSCEDFKEQEKKVEIVERKEKIEVLDKCFALKNDCEIKERWLEDQKYCHPFKKVYKFLEEGVDNYRVVVWHGHGETFRNKPLLVKQSQITLSKAEFEKLNYTEVDCFELMNKYKESFNPLIGK